MMPLGIVCWNTAVLCIIYYGEQLSHTYKTHMAILEASPCAKCHPTWQGSNVSSEHYTDGQVTVGASQRGREWHSKRWEKFGPAVLGLAGKWLSPKEGMSDGRWGFSSLPLLSLDTWASWGTGPDQVLRVLFQSCGQGTGADIQWPRRFLSHSFWSLEWIGD